MRTHDLQVEVVQSFSRIRVDEQTRFENPTRGHILSSTATNIHIIFPRLFFKTSCTLLISVFEIVCIGGLQTNV